MLTLSPELKRSMYDVWDRIADDAETSDNQVAVELVLDANRMKHYGHPDAEKEVDKMMEDHDYTEVHKFLCNQVNLVG